MVRIAGIDLPNNKRVEIGLTYIHGIGRSLSNRILSRVNISPDIKLKDLSDEQTNLIRKQLQSHQIEGDLRRFVSLSIKRIVDLASYRGVRHRKRLPVRGQRTKTNARTRKGPRRIAGKK
ncbi:MAG: 30S ribosomal protein S13 [SAR324 cluster bacterium]|nr:30S ribosomal protein S13 [SAR324 cluster bacterium]